MYDPGQSIKIRQGGHMGGFNDINLKFFFSFNAVAAVDYIYLRVGRVRPGGGGVQASRPI